MSDKVEVCHNCGMDMVKYPEGYLCLKCDIDEIMVLAKKYTEMMIKKEC